MDLHSFRMEELIVLKMNAKIHSWVELFQSSKTVGSLKCFFNSNTEKLLMVAAQIRQR